MKVGNRLKATRPATKQDRQAAFALRVPLSLLLVYVIRVIKCLL